jgi:hypothetical protein
MTAAIEALQTAITKLLPVADPAVAERVSSATRSVGWATRSRTQTPIRHRW